MHSVHETVRPWRDARTSVTRLEIIWVGALLAAVAVLVLGRHVLDGSFYSDDWDIAATYRFAEPPRLFTTIADLAPNLGSRPILTALLPVPHALFGTSPGPQLALALILGVVTCLCFYVLLRTTGMPAVHAAGIAVLALIFPWADSIRLWPAASINTVTMTFAFLGLTLGLHGIQKHGRVANVTCACGAALMLLSILTYEIAAAGLLVASGLYFLLAPARRALRWWLLNATAIGIGLIYTASTTAKDVGSLSQRLHDLPTYAKESSSILAASFLPRDWSSPAAKLVVLALVVGVVALTLRRVKATRDPETIYWLAVAAAAAIWIAAGLGVTLGAHLEPLNPGVGNRGNLDATFGFVLLVYALIVLGARLLKAAPRWTSVVTIAMAAVVVAFYSQRDLTHVRAWDDAAQLQNQTLGVLVGAAGNLPDGSTVFTFGPAAQVAGGIPVFYSDWDLRGAIRLRTGNSSLSAYPMFTGALLNCAAERVTIAYPDLGTTASSSYRSTYFLDVPDDRLTKIGTRSRCESVRRAYPLGPWAVRRLAES